MKINKTENAVKNIAYGYTNKILVMILAFVTRTIIIKTLCIDYIGLNTLFSSILVILSLAELGFGTAMAYSMYKPIADDNKDAINALLNLYKKIYRIIGLIVLVTGILLMPALPYLISGNYPSDINIYTLYLVYLINNVVGYFFFAYKQTLLTAHQRNDVLSRIGIITTIFMHVSQIFALLLFKNYYVYAIFIPITTLLTNIIVAVATKKMYPEYKCRGQVESKVKKEISKQIYALFLHRIGFVIQSSIDSICISTFMGLVLLGKYNNYYYIITAIEAFITIIKQSYVAGIGNSVIIETKDHNKQLFHKFFIALCWIVGWCGVCLTCLYQPFMRIWVKEENMLPFSTVICLVILFIVSQNRGAIGVYKDALGMWYQDKFKPISISIVNLVLTLISAYFGSLNGVILSTVIAFLFVGTPWDIHVFYKYYMKEKPYKYYLKLIYCFIVDAIAIIVTYFACFFIPLIGLAEIVVKLLICLVVPNIIFIVMFCGLSEFKILLKGENGLMGKIKKILAKIYYSLPCKIKSRLLFRYNKEYAHYLKLKKKYSSFVDTNLKCENRTSNYIFSCWLQGEENAPELVKACFKSIKKCMPERKLIIITANNYNDYVDLPEYIVKKWHKGIITNTHFSDILRTALIVKNGGLWLDATVFCTGSIDKYIDMDTSLFVYKNEHRGDESSSLSSWLIYAKPNHPILLNTLKLLEEYWKYNNKLLDYFVYHKLFTIVTEKFNEEWENIPFYSNIEPHVLWFHHFYDNFNLKAFERVKQLSNFHKLSYKFDQNSLGKHNFYDYLINQESNN